MVQAQAPTASADTVRPFTKLNSSDLVSYYLLPHTFQSDQAINKKHGSLANSLRFVVKKILQRPSL